MARKRKSRLTFWFLVACTVAGTTYGGLAGGLLALLAAASVPYIFAFLMFLTN